MYVNKEYERVDELLPPFSTHGLRHSVEKCADFIHLAGYGISDEGKTVTDPLLNERKQLTHLMGGRPGTFLRLVPEFMNAPRKKTEFSVPKYQVKISLGEKNGGSVVVGTVRFSFEEGHDLKRYFSGIWLEEWVFWSLQQSLEKGVLTDLRQGMKPAWQGEDRGNNEAQDFDVAATDGLRLYVIECKATRPSQAHVQKLENIASQFGGAYGRGILYTAGRAKAVSRRIQQSRYLSMTTVQVHKSILDLQPGEVADSSK